MTTAVPKPKSENEITEITRADLFDLLRLGDFAWCGQMKESAFLAKLYDLERMPSDDNRYSNMLQDIVQHRENWRDWNDHNWIFDDPRLDMHGCADESLLQFLCQTVHPIARPDAEEAQKLVAAYNAILQADGYQLVVKTRISGKPIYAASRTLNVAAINTKDARRVADALASEHITAQINRMESALTTDPRLAIGSAKEFVESLCKAILEERGVSLVGNEDLLKLSRITREALQLTIGKDTDQTLKNAIGAMATLTQAIAELRGQLGTGHGAHPAASEPSPMLARMAVGMATTLGVFLYETHCARDEPASA